jgi:hypothetical protein
MLTTFKTQSMPLSFLPNSAGFKFNAICKDGTNKTCVVQKDNSTGLHYVRGEKWENLQAWTFLNKN